MFNVELAWSSDDVDSCCVGFVVSIGLRSIDDISLGTLEMVGFVDVISSCSEVIVVSTAFIDGEWLASKIVLFDVVDSSSETVMLSSVFVGSTELEALLKWVEVVSSELLDIKVFVAVFIVVLTLLDSVDSKL